MKHLPMTCWFALLLAQSLPLPAGAAVRKPTGTYASSGANQNGLYANTNLRGVLIRAAWEELEPSPGIFDFSGLQAQIDLVRNRGLGWSLAVYGGGTGSPRWLTDTLHAPYIDYTFRGVPGYRLPLFWDATVQERLRLLAQRLAREYNSDPGLTLVYVTQMSANGLEGHLQGVNMTSLTSAGYTDARWIKAGKDAARSFAAAFADKALAFEVHEVNGSATVPATIINDLWNDSTLDHRVGAAMWWISGKNSYQPDLISALGDYPGDIYGQVIGRSDETDRFQDGAYPTVFAQAMALGMRYIEPWEYEFKYGTNSANGKWDTILADYNAWADATFLPGTAGPAAPAGLAATPADNRVLLNWADNTEPGLAGYFVHRASVAGGPYSKITGLLLASEYQDLAAINGTAYYYVVTAVDSSGNGSGVSAEVSARPGAAPVPPPATAPAGGGGAPSWWFYGLLALLALVRRQMSCERRPQRGPFSPD